MYFCLPAFLADGKIIDRAEGRNSTSILHVALQLERRLMKVCSRKSGDALFLSVRLRNFSPSPLRTKKKTKVEIKRTAWLRFAPPTFIGNRWTSILATKNLTISVGRGAQKEEEDEQLLTFRAPRTHFSPLTITPTLTLTLRKIPLP